VGPNSHAVGFGFLGPGTLPAGHEGIATDNAVVPAAFSYCAPPIHQNQRALRGWQVDEYSRGAEAGARSLPECGYPRMGPGRRTPHIGGFMSPYSKRVELWDLPLTAPISSSSRNGNPFALEIQN
jgi:hypothetical protein